MSNMSHVRFQNTLQDLRDCHEHLWDDLTDEEKTARGILLKLCKKITNEWEQGGDDD